MSLSNASSSGMSPEKIPNFTNFGKTPIIYYDCDTHEIINDTANILDPSEHPSWLRFEFVNDHLVDCYDLSDENHEDYGSTELR